MCLSERSRQNVVDAADTDFLAALRFIRGELHLDLDYVRGRCVKTAIRVKRDGSVRLETWGRGEAALHWPERMKGKKQLELVS
jgi:hypothetical protein